MTGVNSLSPHVMDYMYRPLQYSAPARDNCQLCQYVVAYVRSMHERCVDTNQSITECVERHDGT